MARILHVAGSPRSTLAFSYRVAQAFIESYQQAHPGTGAETLDLFEADLPAFDAPAAAAKYAVLGGREPADHAARVWQRVIEIIDHFKTADLYVLSSPMWNFSIPYRLKHFLDIIVQPGLTFSYDPQKGYAGLVTGRPLVLALARGGNYPRGENGRHELDFQTPYLKSIFGFIGFEDFHVLAVEDTLSPRAEANLAGAVERARALGREL